MTPEPAPLSRTDPAPLSEQLARLFASRIDAGLMAAGTRLPSIRHCASRYAVSPHTVVAAYDQLLAQGLIRSERNRGFFVRERNALTPAASAATADRTPLAFPNDIGSLIRTMFPAGVRNQVKDSMDASRPSPASGVLPASWLDEGLLIKALRRAVAQDNSSSGALYGTAQGDPLLRDMLALHLESLGITTPSAQIITTSGATHALDVVARTLLSPGDAVLVDSPGWSVEFARLTRMGVRLLPVPRGPQGVDVAALEQLAATHRPKAYTTVSVLHNPTGHSLNLTQAHHVLQLAQQYDFFIVEDDTYAAFAPAHSPRYAALDGLKRTFYVTGFAKIIAPGWRVGCIAAPADWIPELLDTKLIAGLNTVTPTERALSLCLQQGWLRRHTEAVTSRLDAARSRTVQLALRHGASFAAPPAGLFGWVETGVDTEQLAQRLLDHGWLIAPGHLFYPERCSSTRMRLNFAAGQDVAFWRAYQREVRLSKATAGG